MKTFVAFLRAVNVAGHNGVGMRDLCAMAEGLGLANVRSFLQSGNLIVQSGKSAQTVAALLERGSKERLGLATDFIVRSREQLDAAMAGNPFRDEARDAPARLVVAFTHVPPKPAGLAALQQAIRGRERVAAANGEVFVVYPDGIGRSTLTTALLERHLGTPVTARNWNTLTRLAALMKRSPAAAV